MLKITRKGTTYTLELPEGQTITLELVSMLLGSTEVLQGSYSYPFKFPLNEANRQFIDNGHLPEANVPAELPVLVSEGTFSFQALMGYTIDGKYADAYLLVDLGEIADIIKNQPIREFVSETFLVSTIDSLGKGPTMRELAEAEPGIYPIVFAPFLAEDFISDSFEPGVGYKRPKVINPWILAEGPTGGNFLDVVDGEYGYHVGSSSIDYNVVHVPCVYLIWLLKSISIKLGFRPVGPALNDENLKRLVLFNTQTIPGHVNGTYTVQIDRHLPFESIATFFSALRDFLGLGIFFNASDKTAYFASYVHIRRQEQVIDLSESYIPGADKIEKGEWKGFKIINDEGGGDKKLEGMLDFVRSFKIGDRPDKDISLSISTLAMERIVVADSLGSSPPPGGWPDTAIRWFLPSTSVSGNLSNTFFQEHSSPVYEAAANYVEYIPSVAPDMVHIAELAEADKVSSQWGLRLLLYYGLQPDTANRLYPQLSSVSYGSKYQTIGSLSLLPGQPDDVFRKYQRYFFEMLAYSRKLEIPVKLSLSNAYKIKPEIPFRIRLSHQVSGTYLLVKANLELPAKGGYIKSRIEARQLVPVFDKPNWSDPDVYGAKWLELRLENITQNVEEGINYGDIVVYVWEDGGRSIPFNSLSVTANIGVLRKRLVNATATLGSLATSRYSENKHAAGSFQLLQHKNTIFAQIKIYEGRDLIFGGQFKEHQTILFDRYYLQYGEGYRIILD